MFPQENKCALHSIKILKLLQKADIVTKIIATCIRNISETFIVIFMGIPLEYIVYYHHGHD